MFVMTIDQRSSRSDRDRVPDLLADYADASTVRPFDRTAGDEVQAVFDDPSALVPIALDLAASGHWTVGIGVGDVDLPLPDTTRAGRGPAFEAARDAVEAAKRDRRRLRVVGGSTWSQHAQSAAALLLDTMTSRSEAGREAVALMRTGLTQQQAATTLNITPQAMSSRLQAASWDTQLPGEALVAAALTAAEDRL
ncbi:hypothetical protein JVX90_07975 [Gordonia sp. PDNC005]|uniref:hypothetical protein n=1 Tax=unclassified Gordonia (in: high G+C Gram-positive bacteria) TaxID=2657482 RepID=UPI001962FB37|nr:hypothetical protein [Gordonia sp. PDNC005]QRY64107.1 hypothetical protein JVX90_07975 [Gordonia sp. PDNC005]